MKTRKLNNPTVTQRTNISKPVICNETRKKYKSISDAARAIGVHPIQVSRVCNGERFVVHGYTFSFL
jgi:hypothetical protein